jgi:hypothetical protein
MKFLIDESNRLIHKSCYVSDRCSTGDEASRPKTWSGTTSEQEVDRLLSENYRKCPHCFKKLH